MSERVLVGIRLRDGTVVSVDDFEYVYQETRSGSTITDHAYRPGPRGPFDVCAVCHLAEAAHETKLDAAATGEGSE